MTPQEQYKVLEAYCRLKVFQKDWHGVSDAANDIRELLARFPEASPDWVDVNLTMKRTR